MLPLRHFLKKKERHKMLTSYVTAKKNEIQEAAQDENQGYCR
jgi:hypothetical protein